MINFKTYHEVRRLSRELNLTPAQIAAKTGLERRRENREDRAV